jgi:hypothetical protein
MAKNGIFTPYDDNGVPIASTQTGAGSLATPVGGSPAPVFAKLSVGAGLPPLVGQNAAGTTGAGTVYDQGVCHGNFTVAVTVTGAPSGCAVQLQGSLDGTNWYSLGAATSNTSGTAAVSVANSPARYVRANLTTLTGGTSPTVTALIGVSA